MKKENKMPCLILMCGLSGSGKSTTAKEVAKEYDAVIISSDAIREEINGNQEDQSNANIVFGLLHKRMKEHLKAGENVIIDATNITKRARREILKDVSKFDIYKMCCVIDKPYEMCIEDNVNRPHPVPPEVLAKQNEKFCKPTYEEGFDEIMTINYFPKYVQIGQEKDEENLELD